MTLVTESTGAFGMVGARGTLAGACESAPATAPPDPAVLPVASAGAGTGATAWPPPAVVAPPNVVLPPGLLDLVLALPPWLDEPPPTISASRMTSRAMP